jgi:hypothetical protein
MKPEQEPVVPEIIDQLLVGQIVVQAKFETMFVLLETIAKQQGIEKIEGLPLREWFEADRKERMLNLLIKMGDDLGNPSYVARLAEKIKSLS